VTASRADFEARLRAIGAERYHDRHPFHDRLHSGGCTPDQVRAWVINRFYYQSRIPMKDTAFMSRVEDPALRRAWRSRIKDHDGTAENEGGIRRWLRLAEAVGLDGSYVASARGVLPATRFAVDAYVRFVRERTLLEAVASSLTELFAPAIHERRIEGCCGTMPSPTTRASPTSATGCARPRRTWPSGSPGCSTTPTPRRGRTRPPRR
jgi:pyrroloquinoline-quinone synthase